MTDAAKARLAEPDESEDMSDWRRRVADTNISDTSLLATDYLNHFNEVVMLIDMVPDMPECLDDVLQWRPKSYTEHFAESGLPEADLAIAAFEHSPEAYRLPLEGTVATLNRLIATSVGRIAAAVDADDTDGVRKAAGRASRDMQRLVDAASAIINGNTGTIDQDEIDRMFES